MSFVNIAPLSSFSKISASSLNSDEFLSLSSGLNCRLSIVISASMALGTIFSLVLISKRELCVTFTFDHGRFCARRNARNGATRWARRIPFGVRFSFRRTRTSYSSASKQSTSSFDFGVGRGRWTEFSCVNGMCFLRTNHAGWKIHISLTHVSKCCDLTDLPRVCQLWRQRRWCSGRRPSRGIDSASSCCVCRRWGIAFLPWKAEISQSKRKTCVGTAVAVYLECGTKCNSNTPWLIARCSKYLDQHPFITTLHQFPFFRINRLALIETRR